MTTTKKKSGPPAPKKKIGPPAMKYTRVPEAAVAEIVSRLLRRIRAKDTIRDAKTVGQDPPAHCFGEMVATVGAEAEGDNLLRILARGT